MAGAAQNPPSLGRIVHEWGRIGCLGFGGPPAHVALLHDLCVSRRRWMSDAQFERAIAATNLLPGPASTQLAIYCAWRLRGVRGALSGGLSFIVPGLVAILALSVLFLASSPPTWVRGAGMGAGAAVPAVAVAAGLAVAVPIWRRTERADVRARVLAYALAGALATSLLGPLLVVVLLACGALELVWSALRARAPMLAAWPLPFAAAAPAAGLGALAWTAFKVGALAFGGGFVIVPLMQADAVANHHWMTHGQFLDAVALGQVTPGPVVQTVAAVGYAQGGIGAGLLAALIAFSPSFAFIALGAGRFERLLGDLRVRAFLRGAAPAAAGAIVGSAIPLTAALGETWQYPLAAGAACALALSRARVVAVLVGAGAVGVLAALAGAPLLR